MSTHILTAVIATHELGSYRGTVCISQEYDDLPACKAAAEEIRRQEEESLQKRRSITMKVVFLSCMPKKTETASPAKLPLPPV